MLLINKQLLRLGKDSWGWIIAIVVTKLVILLSFMVVVSAVSRLIGSFVGEGNANITSQIAVALVSAVIGLVGSLILGEVTEPSTCTENGASAVFCRFSVKPDTKKNSGIWNE